MKLKEDNIIAAKNFAFAVRCVNLYKFLCEEKHDYVIGKQLLRSGTSIGANVKEAIRAVSKADFSAKMGILNQVNNNYALSIMNYALEL